MLNYYTDYLVTLPDITVYMNCDTRLAINLKAFNLSDYDEFIFTIKNYDYIDSSYIFLFKARNSDMDENGEVFFRIDPDISKLIKPGAFYNFSLLANAFNKNEVTEHRKLTENGNIRIEYGAHDLALSEIVEQPSMFKEIHGARLEAVDADSANSKAKANGTIIDIGLEEII